MKTLVTIVILLFAVNNVKAQSLTKEFVDNWIRQCDPYAEVGMVKAYFINGEYFNITLEDSAFHTRLASITIDKISSIHYSTMKRCNYVPGKGTIGIRTIQERPAREITSALEFAKGFFKDNYTTSSQIILDDSKDPVLIIDGQPILPSIAKGVLEEIDSEEIYDVSVVMSPAPASIYGRNAKME